MTEPSLATQFAALQAERERTWAPEALRRNAEQRARLVSRYDAARHLPAGAPLPPFTLVEPDGAVLTRDALLAEGPLALVFFRFAGCPACNIALPYYERTLWPALRARGVRLIAVSPQIPGRVGEIATRHGLTFTVASDPDNALGNRLGITFEPDEQPEIAPGADWIGATTGTNTWTLPQPTVVLADADGTIRLIDVSPDWLDRTEADTVLAVLEQQRAVA